MATKDRLFSRYEVDRVFSDTSARTLRSWIDMGLVQWASERRDRRGANRLFSVANLYQLAVVRELASVNIPLLDIGTIIKIHFNSSIITEKMEELFGIAMRPDSITLRFSFTFSSAEPAKGGEMLSALLSPMRGPRPTKDDTYISIGLGDPSPPPMVLVLNLPSLKNRVDISIENKNKE